MKTLKEKKREKLVIKNVPWFKDQTKDMIRKIRELLKSK